MTNLETKLAEIKVRAEAAKANFPGIREAVQSQSDVHALLRLVEVLRTQRNDQIEFGVFKTEKVMAMDQAALEKMEEEK